MLTLQGLPMKLCGLMVLMLAACTLAGCATVHPEDLQSWNGVPVDQLDKHSIFLTMKVVRTHAADGTEIRDYINGRNIASSSGGGSVFAGYVDTATYSNFSSCMQSFAACHAIFYIKNDVIDHVSAVGTGGMHCYTNEQFRPGFVGTAYIR